MSDAHANSGLTQCREYRFAVKVSTCNNLPSKTLNVTLKPWKACQAGNNHNQMAPHPCCRRPTASMELCTHCTHILAAAGPACSCTAPATGRHAFSTDLPPSLLQGNCQQEVVHIHSHLCCCWACMQLRSCLRNLCHPLASSCRHICWCPAVLPAELHLDPHACGVCVSTHHLRLCQGQLVGTCISKRLEECAQMCERGFVSCSQSGTSLWVLPGASGKHLHRHRTAMAAVCCDE
jgi:hypothetical protein